MDMEKKLKIILDEVETKLQNLKHNHRYAKYYAVYISLYANVYSMAFAGCCDLAIKWAKDLYDHLLDIEIQDSAEAE